MTVTQIDVDDEALADTMRLSGVRTKKDAVNLALRDFADRHKRIAALEVYVDLAKTWDFETWQRQRAEDKSS